MEGFHLTKYSRLDASCSTDSPTNPGERDGSVRNVICELKSMRSWDEKLTSYHQDEITLNRALSNFRPLTRNIALKRWLYSILRRLHGYLFDRPLRLVLSSACWLADLHNVVRHPNFAIVTFAGYQVNIVVVVTSVAFDCRECQPLRQRCWRAQIYHAIELVGSRWARLFVAILDIQFSPLSVSPLAENKEEQRHQGGNACANNPNTNFKTAPQNGIGNCPCDTSDQKDFVPKPEGRDVDLQVSSLGSILRTRMRRMILAKQALNLRWQWSAAALNRKCNSVRWTHNAPTANAVARPTFRPLEISSLNRIGSGRQNTAIIIIILIAAAAA